MKISQNDKVLDVNAIFWAFIGTLAALAIANFSGWLPIAIVVHNACPPGIG